MQACRSYACGTVQVADDRYCTFVQIADRTASLPRPIRLMSSHPTTICELVDQGLKRNSGLAASTKRGGAWIETSADEFVRAMHECAAGFYDLGVRKGDRVALHGESSTEWLIIDQALMRLGAVSVPIYTTQPADQIRFIVEDAQACGYVVSTEALYSVCGSQLQQAPSMKWTVGLFGRFAEDALTLEDLKARGRDRQQNEPDLVERSTQSVSADDLATLAYTSGTTGTPKGVMLTHGNITTNAIVVSERMPYQAPATVLSFLPLSHSLERMASIFYLHTACPIHFIETTDEFLEDIQTVRPVHMTSVPRLLEKVHAGVMNKVNAASGLKAKLARWALNRANQFDVTRTTRSFMDGLAERLVYSKLRDRLFGGRLKALTSGGAALAPDVQSFFNGIGVICGQGYGLTETSPVITLYDRNQLRPGSVGQPVRDVEVRIAEDGEILARGPNIMKGYYNMPDATAEVMAEDGWFHTGDVGRLEEGHLYITDRKKQLFKLSTGKYVAPTPIEVALTTHPLIEHAVVLGFNRKFCAALIVPDGAGLMQKLGADPSTGAVDAFVQSVVDQVNAKLPIWEQVKKFCVIGDPFTIETGELTPTLKVRRREVFAKYKSEIDALYET